VPGAALPAPRRLREGIHNAQGKRMSLHCLGVFFLSERNTGISFLVQSRCQTLDDILKYVRNR
jgi:hypothetical protein